MNTTRITNPVVIALLVLTVCLQLSLLYRQRVSPQAPIREAIQNVEDQHLVVSMRDIPKLGASNSRLTLIEFSDFECPFCRKHFNETFSKLKHDFVDTGQISYAYMHLPLNNIHHHAMDAAKAAECAKQQGRFWQVHDDLFKMPSPEGLSVDAIRAMAAKNDLDAATFADCVSNATDRILLDVNEAAKLDIRSTPAFLLGTASGPGKLAIHTRINGAQPVEVFASAIKKLLG